MNKIEIQIGFSKVKIDAKKTRPKAPLAEISLELLVPK